MLDQHVPAILALTNKNALNKLAIAYNDCMPRNVTLRGCEDIE